MGLDHAKSAHGRGLSVLFDLFARAIFKHLTQRTNYNPGQNSWDTNAIARQIEASSLPPSPSVQCWSYALKF